MFVKLFLIGLLLMCGPIFGVELVVVRHGETDWNLKRRLQGQIDIELNETGKMQAKETGKKLSNEPFTAIYSSDLKRAKLTASLIAKELNTPPSKGFFTEKRIREISFGELEGENFENEHIKRIILDGHLKDIPGAETKQELRNRILTFLNDIQNCYSEDEKVLIVSHGGVVRQLMRISGHSEYKQVPNGGIFRFRLSPQGKLENFESAEGLPQAIQHG